MTATLLLLGAGFGAGLCGSVAGLASLVSYPALLATGMAPVVASATNTTALLANAVGSGLSSRRDLRGQRHRLTLLCLQMLVGGLIGAACLLLAPTEVFTAVVPWLVALGAALLLGRDQIQRWTARRALRRAAQGRAAADSGLLWSGAMTGIGVYGGYFGAGSGVMLLGALSIRWAEPLTVTNAVKNLATGVANIAAAVVYVAVGKVDLAAAVVMAVGVLGGGLLGPHVVRRLPERPLRIAIGLAGIGLAVSLLV